jgi:hypothetical protein
MTRIRIESAIPSSGRITITITIRIRIRRSEIGIVMFPSVLRVVHGSEPFHAVATPVHPFNSGSRSRPKLHHSQPVPPAKTR